MALTLAVLIYLGAPAEAPGLTSEAGVEVITVQETLPAASPATPVVEAAPVGWDDPEIMKQFIHHRNYKMYDALSEQIIEGIAQASSRYGLHPVDLLALMDVESDYNPGAVSSEGALGLTQVHPPTWIDDAENKHNLVTAELVQGKNCLFDPVTNILAGAYILNHYKELGKKTGQTNPMEYAMTRYLGGKKNKHYTRFRIAIGDYFVFAQQYLADASKPT